MSGQNPTPDYVDEQQIGTKLAQSAIERFLKHAETFVRNRWAAFKNTADDAFSTYLGARQRRARQVRNFIYDIDSVPLESIYVPPDVKGNNRTYTEEQFLRYTATERKRKENKGSQANKVDDFIARQFPAIIVIGPAGIGKSMFANRLFLELCKKGDGKIPILIELRDLNGGPKLSLEGLIASEISGFDASILPEQIKLGLEHGLFTLILDGQDEIEKESEDYYSKIFVDAAKRFYQCPIVITGRPSLEVISWRDFETFELQPMSEAKVVQIIEKLDFDSMTKLNFVDEVRSGLYDTHGEMLSIPLLAIVMLLTFSDTGQISDALHEFYEDAFSALWRKHDAKKEGFQRRQYCGLPRKEFSNLLSAFAASGYARSVFSFRDDDYLRHLSNAMELTATNVDVEAFKKDLVRSTSLCIVDGSAICFCHRTFQEYFAALYILRLSDSEMAAALEHVSDRFETDYVIDLLMSMDAKKIERNWVIPKLRMLLPDLSRATADASQYFGIVLDEQFGVLVWLRDQYECSPSSADIFAAWDARREMIRSFGVKAVQLGSQDEFEELAKADSTSLSRLLENLEKDQERSATAQRGVFGNP